MPRETDVKERQASHRCIQCNEKYELENYEFIFGSICHHCGKFQKVYRG